MCWNATVSLNTFLLGLFAIFFAILNKMISPWESIYYFTVISIQLVEYFTWTHIHNKKINRLLSQIATLVIILLPFWGIICFTVKKQHLLLLIIPYILFMVVVFVRIQPIDYSMTRASNGHLQWNWLNVSVWMVIIYFFFWLSPFLLQKRWTRSIINSIIFFTIYTTYLQSSTWGSMWCWICNIFSIYLILYVFYKDICI